jgi:glycosyltransferase involved in cell wall biosynthesis
MTQAELTLTLDVSAVPEHPGGAGYYTIELARALLDRGDIDITMVARGGDVERWRTLGGHDHGDRRANVRGAVPTSRPGRLLFEQIGFPLLLRKIGARVHHAPHYTMPEHTAVPCVVTIHDCTFFDHPEWHIRSKAVLFRRAIRRASLHAAALVCVSETTAERLRESCEVRAPIVVAPHGVDHDRFTPMDPAPGSDQAVLAAVGVPADRPLVAFVGTLEPRKGVVPLIEAFDRVASSHPDAALVLGGQGGWGMEETERALASAHHGDRIIRTGYLPDAAVPALLRRATVVAYPALEEGFGLPALEALACGAPLITSEGTAMAEFARGAAVLVRPGDSEALAQALDAALEGGRGASGGDARAVAGIRVAAEHTWAASAARHLDAYRLALAASQ